MNASWKMQRFNNGCFVACIAMLLAGEGLEFEDYQLYSALKLNLRVKYLPETDSLIAGPLCLDHDCSMLRPFLSRYGLEFCDRHFGSFQEFKEELARALSDGKCVVSGLPFSCIPSPLYSGGGEGGHAVVFYARQGELLSFYDPSGGIARDKNWTFSEAERYVDHKISIQYLYKALAARKSFVIGSLERKSGIKPAAAGSFSSEELLRETASALNVFMLKTAELTRKAEAAGGRLPYDEFMDFTLRFVKPLAMDWNDALRAAGEGTQPALKLRPLLDSLKALFLSEQKQLKISGTLSSGFPGEFTVSAQKITASLGCINR
ncbi:MAG: hypothetical protein A2270_06565 [Elusimicrobia bacterium RIFOXYA12_FULL_51_18]|nr:MAG: hypothetical protein A2270_06565 [Elusimicrobia bacterium RIFOXYA12_FULL_51_18]OGS29700.1 MAG: hypothetical protein A2218_03295 [Elusimicrobia bacterium RIFOXYA2_FULL_53_38]